MALAYDVAIGVCNIKQDDFYKFRVAADWRLLAGLSDDDPNMMFQEYFQLGLLGNQSIVDWSKSGDGSMPSKILDKRKLFF
jgi:hypothetical protein